MISPSLSRNEVAVGAGIGIPLGLGLLGSLTLLWLQKRREHSLKTRLGLLEAEARESTNLGSGHGMDVQISSVQQTQPYQLEDVGLDELDGFDVCELGERRGQEL